MEQRDGWVVMAFVDVVKSDAFGSAVDEKFDLKKKEVNRSEEVSVFL